MENFFVALVGGLGLVGAAWVTGRTQIKIAQMSKATERNTDRADQIIDNLLAEAREAKAAYVKLQAEHEKCLEAKGE